jgi:hypothetical protein
MTDVPVLLVAFNRPDRLAGLIDALRSVRPTRVYVAVDGPRADRPDEEQLVADTRAQVSAVDWDCEVRTLFRDHNLGCGRGVSGAVTWLFEHEERGIVIEDDLRPHPTFFPFVEELLDRYADDPRVWAVSGCNFVPAARQTAGGASGESYRFSAVPHIWGWATWRRSWADYRLNARGWHRRLSLSQLRQASGGTSWGAAYWATMFELVARGAIDTWDVQAVLTAFAGGRLTATPNVNLVDNVGFGTGSTHTADRPGYLLKAEPMTQPLVHPDVVAVDRQADDWTRRQVLGGTASGMARQAYRFATARLGRA